MTMQQTGNDCPRRCRQAAAVLAILVFVIGLIMGWGFWAALVIGIVVLVVGMLLFPRMFCPQRAASDQSFAPAATPASTPTADPAPAAQPAAAPAPAAEPEPVAEDAPAAAEEAPAAAAPASDDAAPLVKPSPRLAGQEELAARRGTWKYEPEGAPAAAAPAATPAPAATGDDDLKLISGVGPALEKKLHAAGVTSFAQIAGWSEDDVARMDDVLSFKGRISRDDWIGQATTLAAGGETEFSARKKK